MIGITNGINKKSSDFETINVTLNTNQQSHADIVGVNFTLTYGNYTQTFAWKGSPLTIEVPAFVEYTLSFEGVEGYLKPADASYTAQAENSRSVTFTYKTELVQVTVNSDNGASVSGAKVNINGKQQTWNGSVLTQKVPFGTSYTVSVGELSGFSTPASKSFKAEQAVRELSFTYIASALKVNILSNQSTESSWDPTITNIKATVTYGSTTLQVSNGQQINLPSGVDVTISFPEVEGYLKPEDITFTYTGGFVEKSGEYKCELLTVNVSADQGSVSGFEVTISKQATVGVATKYTRLEYIESSGTQYINTGFNPNNNTRVVMDYQLTSTSGWKAVFGAWVVSNGSYIKSFTLISSGTFLRANYGNNSTQFPTSVSLGSRKIADMNKSVCSLSTGESVTVSSSSFTSSYPLYLSAANTSGSATEISSLKIYSCKIYDNGTLVRDYIPALRSDGIAGLYDAVNDSFVASSGSGNFTAGGETSEVFATQISVTGTYKIPFNVSYTVKASNVSGYVAPSSITRVANSKSYIVTQEYKIVSTKDLSLFDVHGNPINRSTANCYVVKTAGEYMFPLVYGNYIKNGKTNMAAATNNGGSNSTSFVDGRGENIRGPFIEDNNPSNIGSTLSVVNSDCDVTLSGLTTVTGEALGYTRSFVKFSVNSIPSTGGNIIIAYTSWNKSEATYDTIWSWHIWLWPHDLLPVEITNSTGVKYNIMPVNLASKYDSDGVHIKNWFYQWGRPTPMLLPSAWNSTTDHTPGSITKASRASDLATGLANPSTFYYNSSSPYNWFGTKSYYNLWDAACTGTGNSDNDTVKTVYDPCPVGWKVPNGNTFTGLSKISEANGIMKMRRYSGDTVGVGFPMSGYRNSSDGSLNYVGSRGCVWLSSAYSQNGAYRLYFDSSNVNPQLNNGRANGFSVLPVQDDLTKIDTI